jgi:sec-independent protein translocase protein TatC
VLRRILPKRLSPDDEATLVEHLTELRHRLLLCVGAIIPALAISYAFHGRLIKRLIDLLPENHASLVTLGVSEPFTTSLKVSFYASLAIVLPFILWQIWSFLAPAVNSEIQRALTVFVVLATALFITGVVFCYAIVLPRALTFLVGYDDTLYNEQIRASYFLSFVTLTLFASGLAFEMPIFILALVRIGVLSAGKLRRNRRIGIAVMTAFAVLLPTVDPVSLALEVIPLLVLFELSIWLAVLLERRMARNDLEENDDDEAFEPEL